MALPLSPLPSNGLNSRSLAPLEGHSIVERRPPLKENQVSLRDFQENGSSSPFDSLLSQSDDRSPSRTSSKASSERTRDIMGRNSPLKSPNRFDESFMTVDTRMDDSVVAMDQSCLSTFSVVPNVDMTQLAQTRRPFDESVYSPSKQLQVESSNYFEKSQSSSRRVGLSTPGTTRTSRERSSSPTPKRRLHHSDGHDNTENLLEFTGQSNVFPSPSKLRGSPYKSQTQTDLASYLSRNRTPSPKKSNIRTFDPSALANLLDFEIPPAPTPRSLPTITAREMESMKSAYLSEISSLKATLSGKIAEVSSLKGAVGDAETRVGEALEQLRDEKGNRESLQMDKDNWEKRGREMEEILRSVKEQILESERDKEALQCKLDDSERRRDDAESKAQETESRLTGMRSVSSNVGASTPRSQSDRDMEIAERVSRELHAAYKQKHDVKVAALKKSYQNRWEKKVKDLESRLEESSKEIDELRTARDSTLTGPLPTLVKEQDRNCSSEADRANAIQVAEEQKAKVKGLCEELQSIKSDNVNLRSELESERIEKGELVAVVEEWLHVQSAPPQEHESLPPSVGLENLRGSISRASGLRGPGFSRVDHGSPKGPARERSLSSERLSRPLGHARSRSNLAMPRSGIMSNIERMGRGRGE
ncbi:MAG: hypothetical protein M1814_002106 [Vezdaea aestivalis]|nr:MAG: hypothetical protein M1814_002106 [Vezdaea aestivalis]